MLDGRNVDANENLFPCLFCPCIPGYQGAMWRRIVRRMEVIGVYNPEIEVSNLGDMKKA